MSKEFAVAVLTPSFRNPSWWYAQSLLGLNMHLTHYGIRGESVSVASYIETQCSLLPDARQKFLNIALSLHTAGKLTHAIFIDDDMKFEPNILDDLCHWGKCIGANYLRKEGNTSKKFTATDIEGAPLDSTGKTGTVLANTLGLGMFCMDLKEVLKTDAPHFEVKYNPATGGYIGEDVYFIRKLKEAKIKTMISHDASHKVGHCGEWVYKI